MESGLCVCRVSLCPCGGVHSVTRNVTRVGPTSRAAGKAVSSVLVRNYVHREAHKFVDHLNRDTAAHVLTQRAAHVLGGIPYHAPVAHPPVGSVGEESGEAIGLNGRPVLPGLRLLKCSEGFVGDLPPDFCRWHLAPPCLNLGKPHDAYFHIPTLRADQKGCQSPPP